MRMLCFAVTMLASALSTTLAVAHEFWLSPDTYILAPGDTLKVRLRVGSGMKGGTVPYLPHEIKRFEIAGPDGVGPVKGRMGDNPAVQMPVSGDGLLVLIHESANSVVIYEDFEVFERFVAHKDFPDAIADHKARGLPPTDFQETYRRYAKSLVAVGSGAGSDRVAGLRIEIVALANPYTDDLSGGMPVQVLLNGRPRADAQVELFETAPGGAVTTTLHRTDGRGRVTLPVRPGREYLVDSVALRPTDNDNAAAGPVWHSDWASLTFHTPG